jgi:hypothetical protein
MNARASFKQIGFGWWIACLLVAIFCTAVQGDQLIPLRETGPRDKRVNLLVLGDGYTAGQEAKFRTDAARFFDATLAGPYTDNYSQYFNGYAAFTASAQAGATDEVFGEAKDTHFKCKYFTNGRPRMLTCDFDLMWEAQRQYLPDADSIVMLVNAYRHGGTGGTISVFSLKNYDTPAHELGHSFGHLADEYGIGGYDAVNLSPVGGPREAVRWRTWIDPATPLPTSGTDSTVGTYDKGEGWYRPTYLSYMRALGAPLGPINAEQMILKMYARVSPFDGVIPAAEVPVNWVGPGQLRVTPKVTTLGLKVSWWIDGHPTSETGNIFQGIDLRGGRSKVTAKIVDDTPQVRLDPDHLLEDAHTWTVDNYLEGALPKARIAGPDRVEVGKTLTLDSRASGGPNLRYHWVAPGFDPAESTLANPGFTARQVQSGTIKLTVTDPAGLSDVATHAVVVHITREQAATALDTWAAPYLQQPNPPITQAMKSQLEQLMVEGGYDLPTSRLEIRNLCMVLDSAQGPLPTFRAGCEGVAARQWLLDANGHLRSTLTGECLSLVAAPTGELPMAPCTPNEHRWKVFEGGYLGRPDGWQYLGKGTHNHPILSFQGPSNLITGLAPQNDPLLLAVRPETLLLAYRTQAWQAQEGLPPKAVINGPASVVQGSSIPFTANASEGRGLSYYWRAPGFTPATSTERSPQFTALWPLDSAAITLIVTDEEQRTDFTTHRLQVTAADVLPPTGTLEGADTVLAGETVSFTAQVSSPSGSPLTYHWNKPAQLTGEWGNVRTVTWTAAPVVADTPVTVAVRVTDADGEQLTLHRPLLIKGSSALPVARIVGPHQAQAGATILLAGGTSTGEGLTYRWVTPGFTPPTLEQMQGEFVAMPPAGNRRVQLFVTDAQGRTASTAKDITVTAQEHRPPTGTLEGPATVVSGQNVTYAAHVTSPDGLGMAYAWENPELFSGSPGNTQSVTWTVGTVPVDTRVTVGLVVSDTQGGRLALTRSVLVKPASEGSACAPAWQATKAYSVVNEKASYDHYDYEVAHWTQNQRPDLNFVITGSAKPWRRLGPCGL